MALNLKDSLNLETTDPSTPSSPNSGLGTAQPPRSNPVCLEVPVSFRRLSSGPGGGATGSEQPDREEAKTVIVFESGAVLRVASDLPPDTPLLLTNSHGQEVHCRVSSGQNLPAIKGYVEVQFEGSAPDFWGALQSNAPTGAPSPGIPRVAMSPAVMATQVPPDRLSPPLSMPAQAEVEQPPAFSATREDDASPVSKPPLQSDSRKMRESEPRLSSPGNQDEFARRTMESRGMPASGNEIQTLRLADATWSAGSPNYTTQASRERAVGTSSREPFGQGMPLTSRVSGSPAGGGSHSKAGRVIGALAVVLALAGAGYVYYFHVRDVAAPVAPPPAVIQLAPPAPPEMPATTTTQALDSLPENPASDAPDSPATASAAAIPEPAAPIAAALAPQEAHHAAENVRAKQPTPAAPVRREISSFKLKAPANADAGASARSDGSSSGAEDLIASGNSPSTPFGGVLPAVASEDNQPAPPGPVFSSMVVSNGPSRPAKQISTTRPTYPEIAKTGHIQGIVVLEVQVNETGKVTGAKAVSGPVQLRQAAIDAVRQWKYEPALSNGTPTPTRLTVNLEFRLQ